MTMDLGLQGTSAIITGASRGIGLAVARLLVAEGASVAICARSRGGVESAVGELRSLASGCTVTGAAVDVGDAVAYSTWLEQAADELDGVDIFIGNAAFTPDGDDDARWSAAQDIDLRHCVTGCNTLAVRLSASAVGSIVLMASTASVMAELPESERAYGAQKAALVSYGAQLAHQLAPDGVRVNTVSPGPTVFPGGVWDEVRRDDPDTFAFVETLPALGRMAAAEEIARVVVFVASPAASYVTGSNWRVDGGTLKHANF
jgi:NAD(P)-dependent dehydrogenase (short-subunit alcohol dehydrogenase family)